jgi:hypothetical protein
MQLYEGTSQIQRLVIAREILMGRDVDEETPEAKAAKAKENGKAEDTDEAAATKTKAAKATA